MIQALDRFKFQLLGLAFLVGLAIYWEVFPPRDPIGTANGVYSSDCCGSLILRDGLLRFGETEVRYVVEHDKVGRYVLPEKSLGVIQGSKVVITSSKSADEIRLHDSERPRSLTMFGTDRDGTLSEFTFVEGPPRD
jgi:hypothetical protein